MAEFTIPDFLQHHSEDEIHEKMRAILPVDIDVSEGGHAWNLTRPTALIVAELCEFILPEVIQLIFPQWAYGEFLDAHARPRGLSRRAANAAGGEITITGTPNTVIPAGSLFSTAAVNGEPSVSYQTTRAVTIPVSGTVKVAVQCIQTGIVGNTGANTIVLVSSRLTGITSVTNEADITGGTEDEDDESLKQRIAVYDQTQGDSYVGSASDYKRWATSVPGVGDAIVVPAQDTSGLITIVITDANGAPASEQLCDAVYKYIMRPDAPEERLAPPNALLKVEPPTMMQIGIKVTVELDDGATLEIVKDAYLAQLADYLSAALDEGEIKYTRVCAVLAATEGANDFTDLQIGIKTDGTVNYGTANIPIAPNQFPSLAPADLLLTAGVL